MRDHRSDFSVVVIGAGHAGVEAALAVGRSGLSVALVTTNIDRIGYMSCNPSIGGLAKGHMVREIDVLGGEMGVAADATCIQFKRLNAGKGPAVRGSRTQNDKYLYVEHMTTAVGSQKNITLICGEARELVLEGDRCRGIVLRDGSRIVADAVVVTTGTFMNAVMHLGLKQEEGGRAGDLATHGISDQLRAFGFLVQRLKTGTPARLDRHSIDWSKTTPQSGDEEFFPFSVQSPSEFVLPQVQCHLSRTTERTHDIIRKNLSRSPLFCGVIEGLGPRYCPSIEDKVTRFSDRVSHQTFLEPESLRCDSIYLQGISTSLPEDAQDEFLRTIPGLESVQVLRYGYAVEYDFILPTQIRHNLETRPIRRLFLAGQINGTSGYEEAAAQGFLAGVNAVRAVREEAPFVLGRSEAYMGVLVDDLVTKGTLEPYRMFTSRAEHRLVLREDNTIERLLKRAEELSIATPDTLVGMRELHDRRVELLGFLEEARVNPNEEVQEALTRLGSPRMSKSASCAELLRREEIPFSWLVSNGFVGKIGRAHV